MQNHRKQAMKKLPYPLNSKGFCALTASISLGSAATMAPAQAQDTSASSRPATAVITRPAWELGIGLGAAYLPDYRGSDQAQGLVIPTPYFVYRSPSLALEGNEIKARLFGSERLTLDASFDFSLGSTLKDNRARQGMSRLPATLSLGPQLSYKIWNSDDDMNRLNFRAPVRQAIALSGTQRNAGLVFEPHLHADFRKNAWAPGWDLYAEVGPTWGNRLRHKLYYEVAPAFATASRPAYTASQGYSGMQGSLTAARRFGDWYYGAYLRFDSVAGASFENSPLVKQKTNWSFATGFTWVLSESPNKVPVLR
jgi:MipA family protein